MVPSTMCWCRGRCRATKEVVLWLLKVWTRKYTKVQSITLLNLRWYQRRCGDYTGMHRGKGRFITYYRFLGLYRHCSVSFRWIQNSRFREKQKKNIFKWRILAVFVQESFCIEWTWVSICSFCVKTTFKTWFQTDYRVLKYLNVVRFLIVYSYMDKLHKKWGTVRWMQ